MREDLRWVPKLRGRIYCSPACGANCTKVAYDTAQKMGTALAKKLGKGWKPHVWENMGWFYKAEKGDVSVRDSRSGFSYTAYFNTDVQQFIGEGDDPKDAVADALAEAEAAMVTIERAVAKVRA